ncbi:MAG: glucose 1-dehydrogenase [Dehalococcoidia bacterium]|nr:glucose 1-dehydrogenase [Dehalococcoidia bacterium]
MDIFDLSGKTAIVTGGNQGIGFAIARGLATAGASVVIANRRAAEGRKAAGLLGSDGFTAAAIPTDVSSTSSVAELVSGTVAEFGKIDILVNAAAVIVRRPVEDISEEEWDGLMDINLKGLFFCCQLVGRHMIERRKGKIINISSNISQSIQVLRSIYAVSKAGVSHLTRALALEWAKYNINVNAIGPGPTITPFNRKYFDEHPDDLRQRIDSIPMGRMGDPSDYVGAAVFLASGASDFVTGQTLLVDGGSTIG